jgi:hypothetical protein
MSEQELTQRTRSFLFCAIGGAVAWASKASVVEMYESGPGAVNLPTLAGMICGGRNSKSSHPAFLRKMSKLISYAGARGINYELPFRAMTKAEVVRTLREDRLQDMAQSTFSCVHYPIRVSGKAKQCGLCPACIGRRQALIAAGVTEDSAVYQYDLWGTRAQFERIPAAELDHFKSMLLQVVSLAHLAPGRPLPEHIYRHLFGTNVVANDEQLLPWINVLTRYRDEWYKLAFQSRARYRVWKEWLGPQLSTA